MRCSGIPAPETPVEPAAGAPIEQPAAAALALRRSVFEAVDGFDERYFPAWFEDVDLARRLADRGERMLYLPAALCRHRQGSSVGALGYGGLPRRLRSQSLPLPRPAPRPRLVVGVSRPGRAGRSGPPAPPAAAPAGARREPRGGRPGPDRGRPRQPFGLGHGAAGARRIGGASERSSEPLEPSA